MLSRNLIIMSILALIVGISSIIPVGYFLMTTAKTQPFDEPWFKISVPYSYWEAKNGTFEDYNYPEYVYTNESRVESLGHIIYLNITLKNEVETKNTDARIEYFIIELTSDEGLITKEYEFIGTNINPSFNFGDFKFSRDGWFDTSAMGGGGLLKYNMTLGESILWTNSGGSTETIRLNSEIAKIRKAEKLFLTVYRLGLVTFSANSTIVTSNNEIVTKIQLEKYNNGWLFNNLIQNEELSEINIWEPVDITRMMP